MSATRDTIETFLDEQRALVNQELERLLPAADEYPAVIHRAMRYSVLAGGKRLRAILCLETGKLLGAEPTSLLPIAGALELVHTYSLIHDDLPALDNDDLRRGLPTCHRAFGEAMAILAGDALLTRAFEVLARPSSLPAERQLGVIHALSSAIGTPRGMVAGQVVDLEAAGRKPDARTLEYIHSAKTGAFIRGAVRVGALAASASDEDLERVALYGEKVGLAFQIVDDLLDVLGSRESLGKAVRKDAQQQKATYPALYGIEESRRAAARLVDEASEALTPYGSRAGRLQGIAQFLIVRTS